MKASIILSTYNRPQALLTVLEALKLQTIQDFEVCIADDGSTKDTQQIIENFQQNSAFPILHAWQDDRGFRAASARNNAVRISSGDYLLFLDGDCIPRPNWIQQHLALQKNMHLLRAIEFCWMKRSVMQLKHTESPLQIYSV